ncbi:MAG: hypothetical protein C5B48_11700 [Candidatus Rokuibacteriota bacterium]|nr:MAG: hypothetical protein C5B48_11700 [Candidatus Rokubacteria bacterium]
MGVRSPHLYAALRGFCFGAFAYLYRESSEDAPLAFAFEEHSSPGRPALYEYRPLARGYVEGRAHALARLEDARFAVEELAREPAAAIFARAHSPGQRVGKTALFRTVLLPLLSGVAEQCGGFEWDDRVFDRAYHELEHSLFGERRAYGAAAPLVGLSTPVPVELGKGLRLRPAATGEFSACWPEAKGLLPPGFGEKPERACVIEVELPLEGGAVERPDAPGEIADAVTALRLATAAPVAAGPVLFERLDWRPLGVRPVLPIAAAEPEGEPTRLDEFRARLGRDVLTRLGVCEDDSRLEEALDRWELALFADRAARAEQLQGSLLELLGGGDGLWAASARVAVLLGESPRARADLFAELRAGGPGPDVVRRALVEVLMHGDRAALADELDQSLLGLAPRPQSYLDAVRRAA